MTQPSGIALFANGNPNLLAEVPAGYTGLAFDEAGNPLVRNGAVNERVALASLDNVNPAVGRVAIGATKTELSPEMPTMWVWDNGDGEIYVRMPFNSTLDLVCNMRRNAVTTNPSFVFDELGTVANTSELGGAPTITSIASFLDETMGYLTAGNGRAGGQHSLEIAEITRAGHGLTTADIGKRFQDSENRQYAITNIISSSVFWLVQQPVTLVGDAGFTRYLPAAATTLTGLDGLSNLTGWTAAITSSINAPTATASLQQRFLVDGRELLPGELVNCYRFDVVEYTRVPNLRNAFTYFTSTGPSAQWTDAALGSMWTRTVKYTWWPWAQLTIEDSARLVANGIRMNDAGNAQYNPLLGLNGSQNLHFLIPGADTVTFNATVNGVPNATINANEPFQLQSVSQSITWGNSLSNQSLIANLKPDHVIHFAAPTTANINGWTSAHLHAFDPTFADTTPSARLTHTHGWLRINPSLKFYPMNFSRSATFPAGTTLKMRSHRRWTPAVTGIDFWTFVKSGEAWLVYFAWRQATGDVTVNLPAYLRNYTATINRAFRGSLVSTNTADGTLTINTSENNGHAIVRLA
jgi:hypothetical protein